MDARTSPLAKFKVAWAVDGADGPASRWPRLVPRTGLEWCCGDMQGMGVPAESLPMPLSAYSVCGWKPVIRAGRLELEIGAPDPRTGTCSPRNDDGCRRHLALNRDLATKTWLAWQALQKTLEAMEARKPAGPVLAGEPPRPVRKPAPRVPGRRWACYA